MLSHQCSAAARLVRNGVTKMAGFEVMNHIARRNLAEAPCPKSALNSYENAIKALNDLATNSAYLQRTVTRCPTTKNINIPETIRFLQMTGMQVEDLDKLKIIHVSGTKGKGSTCAFVESILRHHGLRTGFYSSPHLVSVTERIRLHGLPISRESFANYFWLVYDKIRGNVDTKYDLPPYFQFLTVLSFYVFMREKVDVAIIEVGIGGEFDCTNIVRNTKTVGVTSLGLDHTNILGNTIESIAWQKAGITKTYSDVFTVEQPREAIKVIEDRVKEKEANFFLVPPYDAYNWTRKPNLEFEIDVQKLNISLAIQLAHNWMFHHYHDEGTTAAANKFEICLEISEKVTNAIERAFWPGRCHLIEYLNKNFYLDGAHTVESIQVCTNWYKDCVQRNPKSSRRILIFNVTGNRDIASMMKEIQTTIDFDCVYFVPNVATTNVKHIDQLDTSVSVQEQLEICKKNAAVWNEVEEGFILRKKSETKVFGSVLEILWAEKDTESAVLVTGSLHLVGAFLQGLEEFDKQREN